MTAVELMNVSFQYEGYADQVLKNADFHLAYGEIALLSGYSGEGKSTILGLISGIIPNISPGQIDGEIRVNDRSIAGRKISELCREVAVVLQNAEAQIIQQIVEDEIAFACENFAFSREKISSSIQQVCEWMDLEPNWKTRNLSGGQKQKLMTATSLATEQRIIILDEPLANLDQTAADRLMKTLRLLAQDGYAILIIEHRLDVLLPYVDRVWQLANGRTVLVSNHAKYLLSQAGQIKDGSVRRSEDSTLLELDHVTFTADRFTIIKDASLRLYKGERLLLLGDNGSGKTTLLRLMAGLYNPSSGSITQSIDPKLGRRKNRQWFKRVGMVYQNPGYQLFMPSVREEVAFGAKSEAYAERIMDLFDFNDLADRHPHSLSEGQKRRLSIAAVASTDPAVLLLDEPTVGQDYQGLQKLVQVLNLLHDESGTSIVTVTHDLRCAEALCDRAIRIEDGQIADEGGKQMVRDYFIK